MSKYRIVIRPPSAKRMVKCEVIVTRHHGWLETNIYPVEAGSTEFEFEVNDQYEWIHTSGKVDGDSFSVEVEYTNFTGSRKECYQLVPEKIT